MTAVVVAVSVVVLVTALVVLTSTVLVAVVVVVVVVMLAVVAVVAVAVAVALEDGNDRWLPYGSSVMMYCRSLQEEMGLESWREDRAIDRRETGAAVVFIRHQWGGAVVAQW